MYRPDGWEKTLREILDHFNVTYMNSAECQLIEAGADALLTHLRESGLFLSNTDLKVYGRLLSCPEHYPEGDEDEHYGHLVFITDD